jgi:hypothetical protein
MSEPSRVIVEILVAAPIETVWKTLREPAQICRVRRCEGSLGEVWRETTTR